jgi:mono/diheme cytochrome c family protein
VTSGVRRAWLLALAVGVAAVGLGGLLWAASADGTTSSMATDAETFGAGIYAANCAICHGVAGERSGETR